MQRQHADPRTCHGCSLCVLVCPVWQTTANVLFTPKGRARALQLRVPAAELHDSIQTCTLCGACQLVCPQQIDLLGMLLDLRTQLQPTNSLPYDTALDALSAQLNAQLGPNPRADALILADQTLLDRADIVTKIHSLIPNATLINNCEGFVACLEHGVPISDRRIQTLVNIFSKIKKLYVSDGLLLRALRQWLPQNKILALGQTLSGMAPIRDKLRGSDLYLVDNRCYHYDFPHSLHYYQTLRRAVDCQINIDLQHMAQTAALRSPMTAQQNIFDDLQAARNLIVGKKFQRIVVENLDDGAALSKICAQPVLHVVEVMAAP